MKASIKQRLVRFLQDDLGISAAGIAIAERSIAETSLQFEEQPPNLLAMTLWQYGLVTLEQLDKIFDWLETA